MQEVKFNTPVALDRETFMRQLVASLGRLNEAILGSDVAGAYIMNVGLSMGAAIEAEYKRFWGIARPFTVDEYAHVIVDLKQKIKGNFSLVSKSDEAVVVRTTSCPFDEFVRRSPSLCFMTSSVFGGIAARNFGYAKVVLHKRIALGDPGCYVTIYLRRAPEAEAAVGKEYFPDIDRASPDIRQQLHLMESVRTLRRQLGETTSRWEELVRSAAEAICVIAPDGAVAYVNDRWRDLIGVEPNELVDEAFRRIVHADDQAELDRLLTRVFEGRRVTGREIRLRHRDGSWRHVLTSAGPVRSQEGALAGTLALFHDVTAEREARRLKDEFLSTASHELRTPVTTIKGHTDILLRELAAGREVDATRLAARLRRIQQEADRLALLGADLLDAARHQAGKLTIQTEIHDLRDIVGDAVARQRELLEGGASHTISLTQPEAPIRVAVERARVELVIANLLDNAVKYSPASGEITVWTEVDDVWAHLRISDRGIGISPQDMAQIFTPFFRGSNASSRTFSGLGLGLYLSKAILEAHGGDLTVTSVAGQGSTFTLSLPRVKENV